MEFKKECTSRVLTAIHMLDPEDEGTAMIWKAVKLTHSNTTNIPEVLDIHQHCCGYFWTYKKKIWPWHWKYFRIGSISGDFS
jgi:hypothetical protein